jgi:hypothetical protein
MDLICLSDDPASPCYLLKLERMSILLDCPLLQSTALHFLPLELVPSTAYDELATWRGAVMKGSSGQGSGAPAGNGEAGPAVMHTVKVSVSTCH